MSHSKLNSALKKSLAQNVCYKHGFYFGTAQFLFTTFEHVNRAQSLFLALGALVRPGVNF